MSYIQLSVSRTEVTEVAIAWSIAGEVCVCPPAAGQPPVGAVTPKRWPMAGHMSYIQRLQLSVSRTEVAIAWSSQYFTCFSFVRRQRRAV